MTADPKNEFLDEYRTLCHKYNLCLSHDMGMFPDQLRELAEGVDYRGWTFDELIDFMKERLVKDGH